MDGLRLIDLDNIIIGKSINLKKEFINSERD